MTSYEWLLRLGMEKYADAFEEEGGRLLVGACAG